jgi:tRNA pseudouridine55 synthase
VKADRPRIVRRAVHGVLLLDKGLGASSNGALQQAKRLYRAEKAGHTGTLDPLATGLLPICFGAATKFAQVSLDADKRYLATLKLGVTTTTGDGEGEALRVREACVTRADVAAACAGFVGATHQVPPMHSALKHEGKPLYAYARDGVEVERAPRAVTIHSIEIVEGEADRWRLDVWCSKGTYVRTLAEGIGEALGCGAHLAALRRTASGRLSIEAALPIECFADFDDAALEATLLPVHTLVADWPAVSLGPEDAGRFLAGARRRLGLADAPRVRVHGLGGAFLGTGHMADGELIATRLLTPAEVAGATPAARPRIEEPESLLS